MYIPCKFNIKLNLLVIFCWTTSLYIYIYIYSSKCWLMLGSAKIVSFFIVMINLACITEVRMSCCSTTSTASSLNLICLLIGDLYYSFGAANGDVTVPRLLLLCGWTEAWWTDSILRRCLAGLEYQWRTIPIPRPHSYSQFTSAFMRLLALCTNRY